MTTIKQTNKQTNKTVYNNTEVHVHVGLNRIETRRSCALIATERKTSPKENKAYLLRFHIYLILRPFLKLGTPSFPISAMLFVRNSSTPPPPPHIMLKFSRLFLRFEAAFPKKPLHCTWPFLSSLSGPPWVKWSVAPGSQLSTPAELELCSSASK